jgi:O-antigen/teichoic acid export membrane protein
MFDYIKKTFSVFFTEISILFLNVVSGILIARLFGPSGKGVLAIMLLIAIVLKLIGGLGLDIANVYIISKKQNQFHKIFSNNVLIWVVSVCVLCLVMLIIRNVIDSALVFKIDQSFFDYSIFLFPFVLWFGLALSMFQGLDRFKEFNLLKIMEPTSKLVGIFFFALILHKSIEAGAFAILLSYIIPTIASFLFIKKFIKRRPRLDKHLLKSSINYGLKGQIGVFFQFFNYRFDMFLVGFFLDTAAVGFYSLSVMIAELLWYIPNSIALTMFPKISREERLTANEFTVKIARNSIPIMLICAVFLGLVGRFLIPVLYGKTFMPSVIPLQILLPGIICFGLVKILTHHMHGMGKPQYGSIVTICSLFLTVIFDFLLIPQIGIIGAAMATSTAYIISLILTICFFKKVSGLKMSEFLKPSFQVIIFLLKKNRVY